MKGFFASQGNQLKFEGLSFAYFYTYVALCLIAVLIIWIFKKQIHNWYVAQNKVLGLSKRAFYMTIGITILVYQVLRTSWTIFSDYPLKWEVLPLHFCRLFLMALALVSILNKPNWVKYFGIIGFLATLVALAIPSFESMIFPKPRPKNVPQNIGLDAFIFHDYLIVHTFILIYSVLLFIFVDEKITAKEIGFTFLGLSGIFLFISGINWLTNVFWMPNDDAKVSWASNFWYTGFDKINSQVNLMGPLTKWPFNIFTFMILGGISFVLLSFIWMLQKCIYLEKDENNRYKIKVEKHAHWIAYLNSFKQKKKEKVA
ncbi:YwaF family protein [Mycoplasmopsis opalescens]|uniref:YwaF family protein n=1 Tax=Mycoplasmopsis opalescens TaxID=114886 RepID=UPI0004A6B0CC|nr:YwaF family protein [Mycoplasmopsis opalescens]